MRTKIRHFRKLQGLTQTDLAQRLGTTAATVSRLETSDMTVSMEWLERFAEVFHIHVAELIDDARPGLIPCVGEIGSGGSYRYIEPDDDSAVALTVPARDPIALRILESVGPYLPGDIVIADRLSPEHAATALGRDCIVEVDGEDSGFGRFISSADGSYLLVPHEPGSQARPLPTPDWIAPVVMLIRYL